MERGGGGCGLEEEVLLRAGRIGTWPGVGGGMSGIVGETASVLCCEGVACVCCGCVDVNESWSGCVSEMCVGDKCSVGCGVCCGVVGCVTVSVCVGAAVWVSLDGCVCERGGKEFRSWRSGIVGIVCWLGCGVCCGVVCRCAGGGRELACVCADCRVREESLCVYRFFAQLVAMLNAVS